MSNISSCLCTNIIRYFFSNFCCFPPVYYLSLLSIRFLTMVNFRGSKKIPRKFKSFPWQNPDSNPLFNLKEGCLRQGKPFVFLYLETTIYKYFSRKAFVVIFNTEYKCKTFALKSSQDANILKQFDYLIVFFASFLQSRTIYFFVICAV